MKIVLAMVCAVAALYLMAGLLLFAFQRRLIYHPDSTHYTPSEAQLNGVSEIVLQTPDRERVIAWYTPAAPGYPTLLYFHGNAGGLIGRSERITRFATAGYGVFMSSYRSYSGSTGKPSEAAIIADAQLAYDHLTGLGVPPRMIVPYGESLGSGVAVQLAAARDVGAVVLDAPYTSLIAMGRLLYGWLPVAPFMLDRYDSKSRIAAINAPLLIMHGSRDRTIPLELGQDLFQAAREPKQMAVIEGAGHSDIYAFDALPVLQQFLQTHLLPARAGTHQPNSRDIGRERFFQPQEMRE